MRRCLLTRTVCLLPLALAACAIFGRSGGGSGTPIALEDVEQTPISERREEIRRIAQREFEEAAGSGPRNSEVLQQRPYFFKEYVEFPEGTDNFRLEIRELESQAVPYAAEAAIDQVRYTTRFHRSREEAIADDNFLRDTGTLNVTYEWRNGQWRRVASFFVADRTEELVDGQWVQVEKPPQRAVPEERGDEGWFNRTMRRLQFWR